MNRQNPTVYVVDGSRTPFLRVRGKPGPFTASDLAVQAGRPLLARQPFAPERLDHVILGCVSCGPDEANIARERRFLQLTHGTREPAWTDSRIHGLLSDHDDGAPGPNPLCRHDPHLGGDTIASALLDPGERTLRVLWGWPCGGSYGEPIPV